MSSNTTEVPEKLRIKLAEHLKELKDKRRLGFNQLSIKSEVNPGVLTKILNGTNKRVNPYQLKKLAYALRVDYKELYKIVGYLDEEDVEKEVINEFDLDNVIETIRIPLYDSISAGCGVEEGQILDFINVPILKNPQDCFAVNVKGDSMEPNIPNGSIIIVRKNEEIPNNKIGAFITDDGAMVKRVQRTKKETFLISDNPKYPPKVIDENSLGFYECGRVIKLLLDL